jgi:hypothetical protein
MANLEPVQVKSIFDGIDLEIDLKNPKELSAKALELITKLPNNWDQKLWHKYVIDTSKTRRLYVTNWELKSTHCYAGWCDLVISYNIRGGFPKNITEGLHKSRLTHRVVDYLSISSVWNLAWQQISHPFNKLDDLISCHNEYYSDNLPFATSVPLSKRNLSDYR